MYLFKRPITWFALLTWGLATVLSIAAIRAVSEFDARTWPELKLDPVWTGPVSVSNQTTFLAIFIGAYAALILAGALWGKVFEIRFGRSASARIALLAGILSTGSCLLWAVAWRITFWLEDMGYYIAERSTFENLINFVPLGVWIFGGLTFFVFSILAANTLGKR